MLTATQNLLETIKVDGKPERLLKQYEGATFFPAKPGEQLCTWKPSPWNGADEGSVWNRDPVASGAVGCHAPCNRE